MTAYASLDVVKRRWHPGISQRGDPTCRPARSPIHRQASYTVS
jgi:hypothetical protein